MDNKRVYQMIALCQKAGKLVTGEFATKQAVLAEQAYCVIVTEDASAKTKKLFNDKCSYRKVPFKVWGLREELGRILGKEERVAIAILDQRLGETIYDMLE